VPYIPKDLQADTKLVYTTRKYITQAVSVPSKEWKIQFSQPLWRIEWKEGS